MMSPRFTFTALTLACAALAPIHSSFAQDQVVNVYSARHYPGDDLLYNGFTKVTGIKINRVDADDAGIVQRLKAEGTAQCPRRRHQRG